MSEKLLNDKVECISVPRAYWLVKERRDHYRQRVSKAAAPWFDGSAFPS